MSSQYMKKRSSNPPTASNAARRTARQAPSSQSMSPSSLRPEREYAGPIPEAGVAIRQHLSDGLLPERLETMACESCGLQFFPPSPAAPPDWYESVERYGPRWEYREALADLPKRPSRVLEIGCGEGW